MISPLLWRALRHPQSTHPLFVRFNRIHLPNRNPSVVWWFVIGVLLCVIITFIVVLPFMFTVFVNIQSLNWLQTISSSITREKERRTHDLLSVLPAGIPFAHWMIGTAHIYREDTFSLLRTFARAFIFLAIGFVLVLTLIALLDSDTGSFTITEVLLPIALTFVIYLDFMQTIILALVIGMAAPMMARTVIDARVLSFVLFAMVQLVAYIVLLISYNVVPNIIMGFHFSSLISLPVIVAFLFAMLLGTREAALVLLWGIVSDQTVADFYASLRS
jgi:hypothetical protein